MANPLSSLTTSSILILLLLLVLVPRPLAGLDVDLAAQWSATFQEHIEDIDQNTLLYQQILNLLNGFESLDPPDRETADSKWIDLLANQVGSLMESRINAVRNLATSVETLYCSNVALGLYLYHTFE
jgi:hypothetical protein